MIFINALAKNILEFIENKGVKKTWIMEQLGVSSPYFYKLINKKTFGENDANKILAPLGYKVKVSYEIEKI